MLTVYADTPVVFGVFQYRQLRLGLCVPFSSISDVLLVYHTKNRPRKKTRRHGSRQYSPKMKAAMCPLHGLLTLRGAMQMCITRLYAVLCQPLSQAWSDRITSRQTQKNPTTPSISPVVALAALLRYSTGPTNTQHVMGKQDCNSCARLVRLSEAYQAVSLFT